MGTFLFVLDASLPPLNPSPGGWTLGLQLSSQPAPPSLEKLPGPPGAMANESPSIIPEQQEGKVLVSQSGRGCRFGTDPVKAACLDYPSLVEQWRALEQSGAPAAHVQAVSAQGCCWGRAASGTSTVHTGLSMKS